MEVAYCIEDNDICWTYLKKKEKHICNYSLTYQLCKSMEILSSVIYNDTVFLKYQILNILIAISSQQQAPVKHVSFES